MSAGEEPDGRAGDRSSSAAETERTRRGSDPAERDAETAQKPEPATPITQHLGRIIVAIVAMLFLVFSFFNVHEVEVDWLLAEAETPLIVLLIGAFVVGLLVGAGIFWRRQHVRTRLERRDGHQAHDGS